MKLASYVGTRDSIMGLGNRLIRLRLSGIRQALQTDNTSIQDTLRASHSEIVFEPGDGVDHLMPDGTCQPNEKGELWCVSSVGLERIPHFSTRRAGSRLGINANFAKAQSLKTQIEAATTPEEVHSITW